MIEAKDDDYRDVVQTIQDMYDSELGCMDTFSESVAQQIRDELLRCQAEAREYWRKKGVGDAHVQ